MTLPTAASARHANAKQPTICSINIISYHYSSWLRGRCQVYGSFPNRSLVWQPMFPNRSLVWQPMFPNRSLVWQPMFVRVSTEWQTVVCRDISYCMISRFDRYTRTRQDFRRGALTACVTESRLFPITLLTDFPDHIKVCICLPVDCKQNSFSYAPTFMSIIISKTIVEYIPSLVDDHCRLQIKFDLIFCRYITLRSFTRLTL
jgi:hypothetical protein